MVATDCDHTNPRVDSQVWIVVPAFNEAGSVGVVVSALRARYAHVAVVDDGSDDRTGQEAMHAGAVVLRHIVNRGQGAALQTGLEYALGAGAQFVVTFDSDGQHAVEDISALLAPLVRGEAEIALGSRFLDSTQTSIPFVRRAVLRAGIVFTRVTSGARVTDTHNGIRAFSREAATRLRISMDRMAHASELLDQVVAGGLRYVEVPVRIRYTAYSRQKGQRSSAAFRIALDYIIARVFG